MGALALFLILLEQPGLAAEFLAAYLRTARLPRGAENVAGMGGR